MISTDVNNNNLKKAELVADIIDYRVKRIKRIKNMLYRDISKLSREKSDRNRKLISVDIAEKIDILETLISKNIDDVMSVEWLECSNQDKESDRKVKIDKDDISYIQ